MSVKNRIRNVTSGHWYANRRAERSTGVKNWQDDFYSPSRYHGDRNRFKFWAFIFPAAIVMGITILVLYFKKKLG